MAVKAQDMLTYEQLIDNYEYKVSKKILIREYPWIKDVTLTDDGEKVNEYNLIFITLHINPFELSDITGWSIAKWAFNDIKNGITYWSPYLSTLMNVPYEEAMIITNEIDDTIKSIHTSSAIPQELRLPTTRKLSIGRFSTQEGITIPTSYVDWVKTLKD